MRRISRDVAPDVDGWITQARQLQDDIAISRRTAREIVQQAEEAARLKETYTDYQHKVSLLTNEVEYTLKLKSLLGAVAHATQVLNQAKEDAIAGRFAQSLDSLSSVEGELQELRPYASSSAIELIGKGIKDQHQVILSEASKAWHESLYINTEEASIRINLTGNHDDSTSLSLSSATKVLARLHMLDACIARFAQAFDKSITRPRFGSERPHRNAALNLGHQSMAVRSKDTYGGPTQAIDDVKQIVRFFTESNLPTELAKTITNSLMPSLTSHLIDSWLTEEIPVLLSEAGHLQTILERVRGLSDELIKTDVDGQNELAEWVDRIPKIWLAKRRELSLAAVREVLLKRPYQTKVVERVEKQMMSRGIDNKEPVPYSSSAETVRQDATATPPASADFHSIQADGDAEEEEDDASAWDVGDEDPLPDSTRGHNVEPDTHHQDLVPYDNGQDDDDVGAWGWDDQDSSKDPGSPSAVRGRKNTTNGRSPTSAAETTAVVQPDDKRELTLSETYTITGVPDQLRDVIVDIIRDAETLRGPEFANSPISPAAPGLYSLPTLALAGFRALASTCYGSRQAAHMLLYNDCLRLAAELEELAAEQRETDAKSTLPEHSWPSSRLKLASDVQSIQSFGRRAYGREMESQRTIVKDLLDGAQGFTNCTEVPFASECSAAVSATIDRVRDVGREWKSVLSHSALLQSLGSLLSTVMAKVISDIEDLGDISEAESKQLRGFCDDISALRDLFPAPATAGEGDVCGVYTPMWFKFQYMGELLEASLADIRYPVSYTHLTLPTIYSV